MTTEQHKEDYLSALNNIQRDAVEQTEGAVMIIAGPGSGKTRVLTFRIAHLLQQGVPAYNILALTFTNKAAREMKERVAHIAGEDHAKQLFMGTFHAIFARILRIEAEKIGYLTNFTIYDTEDTYSLLKSIIQEKNLNPDHYKPSTVWNRISNAKNNLLSAQYYLQNTAIQQNDRAAGFPLIGDIYLQYQNRCHKANVMDFDDLLLKTYQLLHNHPDVLQKYQNKFKYLLIDEFQDTNRAQYAIVQLLALPQNNICIVGDDAQSIYAFRGATIENILRFEKEYPALRIFKLEQNYRSTQYIVQAANNVIAHNSRQLNKTIWTANPEGSLIRWIRAATDADESRLVAESIHEECLCAHFRNEDIAILYRTNAQSRLLEEALRRKGIPYRVFGGMSFFQRKEVKDLMAYLRLIVNPTDSEALRRIINYPTRGIGNTSLSKIVALSNTHSLPLWDIVANIAQYNELGKAAQTSVQEFAKLIKYFIELNKSLNAHELAVIVAKQSGLQTTLHNDKTVEGISRYENIVELQNSIKAFVDAKHEGVVNEQSLSLDDSLGAYLQEASLLTDLDNDNDDTNKVKLMTVHNAKGLEFACVYLVGLEENLFPSKSGNISERELEEERRLFYVAITRAKQKLLFSSAAQRYRFGEQLPAEPSRFIDEIDPKCIEAIGFKASATLPMHDKSSEFQKNNSAANNLKALQRQQTQQTVDSNLLQIPENFKASNLSNLQIGNTVAHQRFGIGKIVGIEGRGDDRIANIQFEHTGDKKIMLRFAKLMILP